MCVCSPGWKIRVRERSSHNDMASEWDLQNPGEMVLGLGIFNGHVGRRIDGFEGVHGGYGIGKRNVEGRRLLEFCAEKELCVANAWFKKKKQRKRTCSMGGNQNEIDFVLSGPNNRKYLKDVKANFWELQHRLVVTNIDKRKLKENNIKAKFQERLKKLVDVDAPNLWNTFKSGMLQACDLVREKKKDRRKHGDKRW